MKLVDCPSCMGSHHPAPKCPYCGHIYAGGETVGGRVIEEVEAEIEEIDVEAMRRQRNMEQAQADTLEALVALATARQYRSPEKWASHVWTARKSKERGMQ